MTGANLIAATTGRLRFHVQAPSFAEAIRIMAVTLGRVALDESLVPADDGSFELGYTAVCAAHYDPGSVTFIAGCDECAAVFSDDDADALELASRWYAISSFGDGVPLAAAALASMVTPSFVHADGAIWLASQPLLGALEAIEARLFDTA